MKIIETLTVIAMLVTLGLFLASQRVHPADPPNLHCEGMARPSEAAPCPPANPPTAAVQKVGGEICWAPGGDCVEFMLHNRAQYCVWASDMASVGAWLRIDKHLTLDQTLAQLNPQMRRPLTANEAKHINYWLTWGWLVGGVNDVLETRRKAEQMCRSGDADADHGAASPGGIGIEG